jgi:integrase
MEEIATLLRAADADVVAAQSLVSADPTRRTGWQQLFGAEQNRLLIRLAANSGARLGELATLRLSDLDGQVLTIERNRSLEVLGPTKSKRTRRMTIGATTAAMIRQHFDAWAERVAAEVVGDWIFAPDYRRAIHARASLLSHRFVRFRDRAGVRDAALHRFRHAVATALVEDGKILKAQARLGHTPPRPCATTRTQHRSTTSTSPTSSTDDSTPRRAELGARWRQPPDVRCCWTGHVRLPDARRFSAHARQQSALGAVPTVSPNGDRPPR